ncbi:Membrane dipeptidase [Oscillochloris trichoides DG-6]|uniref:Membrane dipeptidase n=1 Tax=Oscillochloris trichoides DG-6 TaxID=765420 RepID=E1IEH0_9CHLR|nr:dipeptidase [Oscillochloris trichoides]EFO80496.1 Membrane dipeptidase [Oscillochloris trichoides DG-6]
MDWPIFDGHNDTLFELYLPEAGKERSFFIQSDVGHLDLPRARAGGLGGGFFAVYLASPPSADQPERPAEGPFCMPLPEALDLGYSQRIALAMSGLLFRLEAEAQGALKVVRDARELRTCLEQGVVAAILHFEGAEAIDPGLEALDLFYQAGLRSLGPVWSRPNAFGHGVPFAYPHSPDTGPGLTAAGQDLIRACNRLGIMIDLSHLNEAGFWDVARISTAPLVATHSNAHALCPSSRNLTDKQLAAIRESDGMVGLNFAVSFLRPDGRQDAATPISIMVDHVLYLVEQLGIDRVGFGSDFDGATIPQAIGDVRGLPHLMAALAEHFGPEDLRKLAYANWVRVLAKTWREG